MPSHNRSLRLILGTFFFLLAVSFWILTRTLPFVPVVFPEGAQPVLLGNDPWYHLHHSAGAAEHFPHLLRWDVGIFYPTGNHSRAAGLFNLGVAGVSILLDSPNPSQETIMAVLAWSPVLLGFGSLVFLAAAGWRLGGARLALLAVVLRALFPGVEFERTMLGFGDNHAAEIFLASALLWSFLVYFDQNSAPRRLLRSTLSAVTAALPVVLFLYTWYGAPLHLAMLSLGCWLALIFVLFRGISDTSLYPKLAWYFGAIFLLTASTGFLFPRLVMYREAFYFTLLALGILTGLSLAGAGFSERLSRRIGAVRTAVAVLVLPLVICFLIVALIPQMREFLALITKARSPFVSEHQEASLFQLWRFYGILLVLFPIGLWYLVRKSGKFCEKAALLYIVLWSLLWCISSDYGYLAGSVLPLFFGKSLLDLFEWFRSLPGKRLSFLRFTPGALLTFAVLQIWPLAMVRVPFLPRDYIENYVMATPPWWDAMAWLQQNTPATPISPTHLAPPWKAGGHFEYPPGSYGVLCHWQYGNLISTLGKRIPLTACSPVGKFINWFLHSEESESIDMLSQSGDVRYLVLDAVSVCESFPSEIMQSGREIEKFQIVEETTQFEGADLSILSFGEEFRRSVGARLFLGDGAEMGNYRLVYESPQQSFLRYRSIPDLEVVELRSTLLDEALHAEAEPLTVRGKAWVEEDTYLCYSGVISSTIKIFERVPGAIIQGQVPGTAPVTLTITLHCPKTGREFDDVRTANPDPSGRVAFRVPYPTGIPTSKDTVYSTSPYRLQQEEGDPLEIEVSENAVRLEEKVSFSLMPDRE